jgi:hypothetical protein
LLKIPLIPEIVPVLIKLVIVPRFLNPPESRLTTDVDVKVPLFVKETMVLPVVFTIPALEPEIDPLIVLVIELYLVLTVTPFPSEALGLLLTILPLLIKELLIEVLPRIRDCVPVKLTPELMVNELPKNGELVTLHTLGITKATGSQFWACALVHIIPINERVKFIINKIINLFERFIWISKR